MEDGGRGELGPAASAGRWVWRLGLSRLMDMAARFVKDSLRPIAKPFQQGAGMKKMGLGVGRKAV